MGQFELSYQEREYAAALQRGARTNLIAYLVGVALLGGIGGMLVFLSTKEISDLFMNLGTPSAESTTPLLVKAIGGFVLLAVAAGALMWLLARSAARSYAGMVYYNLVNKGLLEEALGDGVYQKYPRFGLHRYYGQHHFLSELLDRGIRALQTDSAPRRLNHLNKSYTYLCQVSGLRAFPSGFTEISVMVGTVIPICAAGLLFIFALGSLGFGSLLASLADNPATSALLVVIFAGPIVYFAAEKSRQELGTANGIADAVNRSLDDAQAARQRADRL
jgi:hypothetical protein